MSQGSAGQFGYGWELAEGIPGTTQFFARIMSESLGTMRDLDRNPNIDPSNQMPKGKGVKAEFKGKVKAAMDTESMLRMRIQHRGYDVITNPTAGVYQHVIRPRVTGDSATTPAYIGSLWAEINRDDGATQLITGLKCDEVSLKIQENKIIEWEHNLMGLRDTYQKKPLQIGTPGTYNGAPQVRGHRFDPLSADKLKMKVKTAGAFGTATIQFTRAAIAYHATTAYVITADTWIPVIIADGSDAGIDRGEKVEVLFPTANAGAFVATEEWEIDPVRPIATPTYTTRDVLTAVGAEATLGGITYAIHSLDIKGIVPKKQNFGLGSKYAQSIIPNGQEKWTLSIDRDYTDKTFLLALIAGGIAVINVPVFGDKIGATAYYEQHQFGFANVQYAKAGTGISSPNSLPEKIEAEAFMSGSTQPCIETVVNTISSIG